LNKVNLCWVFSEGRPGHEIQSSTLASHIAHQSDTHVFSLRQPWLSLTPRIIPGFKKGLIWQENNKPDFMMPPDVIITAGRIAAAVGKFVSQRFRYQGIKVNHIHILNPRDSASNYDLLLLPEHDQKSGSNIISYSGSIHPFDSLWFNRNLGAQPGQDIQSAIVIGNPPKDYFKQQLAADLKKIRRLNNNGSLMVCGSPRLPTYHLVPIKALLRKDDCFWFGDEDGANPYRRILCHAQHIFVTADSINMMNECAASKVPVTLLATSWIKSPKHKRFIHALGHRWSDFETITKPVSRAPYALSQIVNDVKFQKLLNSPNSSNSG